jgi:ribose transport system ATP-binding protein
MNNLILEVKDIAKNFFGVPALKNVSFKLSKGNILGLIGENGAGKSTLMNIIGGVIPFDNGEMILNSKKYVPQNPADATKEGIAFIHQELNLFTNLSIEENIFINNFPRLGKMPFISKRIIRNSTKELLDSINLKVAPDTLVEKLAPGERQLVEIAKALSTNAQIIIFDEPTTSLTNRETERLFELIGKLKFEGKSIIYISHILDDVKRLSDEIAVLRDGVVVGSGPQSEFTIKNMISLMVGRDINQLYPEKNTNPSQEKVLEVKGLSQKGIVENIDFDLSKGEVLGIFGLMGSGRSELARIIFGLDPYEKGEIIVDGKLMEKHNPKQCIQNGIAFLTENRRDEGLLMDFTIQDNIQLVALPEYCKSKLKFVDKSSIRCDIENVAGNLRIKCASIEKSTAKSLSGGNQQKVVIGKWLMSKPAMLIVDEPTRGIDVGAKYEVYNIVNELASRGTGVLMISSEIEELIGTCDRILVMSKGEILGNFTKSEFDRERILASAFRQNVV